VRNLGCTLAIAVRLAQREVMQLKLREGFAAAEVEVLDNVVAVLHGPLARDVGGLRMGSGSCEQRDEDEATDGQS
jgi:hypothetical protein